MNMKQSCKALISAIEGELDGRHCTEEQAAAILDHALPSLTEALARVEAERDEALEFMRINARSGMSYAEQRATAQAQLAEAVGLLRDSLSSIDTLPGYPRGTETADRIEAFLARHAQAEQQEAQGAQDGEEARKAAFENHWYAQKATAFSSTEAQRHFDAGWKARAALATQPAVPAMGDKPTAYVNHDANGKPYLDWVPSKNGHRALFEAGPAVRGAEHE